MNQSLLPMIMDDSIRMISVRFDEGSPSFSYMTSDPTIEVGDMVLVETRNSALKAVKVVEVDVVPATNQAIEYKFIVCKVDFAEFEANKARAKELIAQHSAEQFKRWRHTMRIQLDGDVLPAEETDPLIKLAASTASGWGSPTRTQSESKSLS